jgi:hypothetical protein
LAFFNRSVATFDIPIPEEDLEDGLELYRVVSSMVVNKDGAFEKPPGWTGEPGSPTFTEGEPDPAVPNEEHERVHEAGFMRPNQTTFVFKRSQNQPLQRPFQSGGFSPVKRIQVSTATNDENGLSSDQVASASAQDAIASAMSRHGVV